MEIVSFNHGQTYSISNTCKIDSGLFILFYLYKTDEEVAEAIDVDDPKSPYSILRQTFQYVDTDGWDVARIYWLLTNKILKPSDRNMKNLFGSMDENVFRFVKEKQRYARTVLCTREECRRKKRIIENTELFIE